jgi:hypothetical protein
MPNYTPLSLTRNPFDPAFVDPNDLLTIPVAGKAGLDHLSAKVTEYEKKLSGLADADFNRHSVCVTGPSKGGRSTFLKLLTLKLNDRLAAVGMKPAGLYRYASHPDTQINDEAGPNVTLKNILRGLLVDMTKNGGGRFDTKIIAEVFGTVLSAKELADISNAFVQRMDLSLSGLQEPLVLIFENLNSAGLYQYLQQTFLNIPSILMITSYSSGAAGIEFQAIHGSDRLAWWTNLDPVDCREILALTEHNLNRARSARQPGVFPFEQAAIEGFFAGGINRQPIGRLMHACFYSIENKATNLETNAAAPIHISHQDMQEALQRR